MKNRANYRLLSGYISKEFAQNFIVAFLFFFSIFFINSILLLVQRILLKNINMRTMLEMVALSMPQFLVYIFPFATLTATSMVLGDLGSQNELLAIRSCGISSFQIYKPIIVISVVMSLVTFFFADVVHPWSSVIYKDKLATLMADMPTFELESNGVNTVGNYILYTGHTEGNTIENLVLISKDESDMNKLVLSERGELELVDPNNYVYALSLDNPEIFLNDPDDIASYGLSSAEKATFFLDFSEQIPSLTSNSPVNLTSRELLDSIKTRNISQKESRNSYYRDQENKLLTLSKNIREYSLGEISEGEMDYELMSISSYFSNRGKKPTNFYGQYYKAELTKKFVLSLACFCLTLIALPLSNIRVKHGKLTGFAIALLLAVAFWYMIFVVQLFIFDISSSPYWLMALPDLSLLFIGIVLALYFRKAR